MQCFAMDNTLDRLGQTIKTALPASVTGTEVVRGELTVTNKAADIVKLATFLRDDPACQFICIIDITAIDWPGRERRFDVVNHFRSPRLNQRIRVKIEAGEDTPIPSIIGVYPGADWFERETYDLYGVLFTGHPDVRRLLTDYGFEGNRRLHHRRDDREPRSSRIPQVVKPARRTATPDRLAGLGFARPVERGCSTRADGCGSASYSLLHPGILLPVIPSEQI
jgi:NADH-quinone oxidoreductase subunit C